MVCTWSVNVKGTVEKTGLVIKTNGKSAVSNGVWFLVDCKFLKFTHGWWLNVINAKDNITVNRQNMLIAHSYCVPYHMWLSLRKPSMLAYFT